MPALIANGRRLVAAGVFLIAGTDAGIAPIKPPDAIRWAVRPVRPDRADAGAAPCRHAPHGPRRQSASGTERADSRRDTTPTSSPLDGDPLTDPEAVHRIRAVYLRGTALDLTPST